MFLLILSEAYDEETVTNKDGSTDTRAIMRIPPKIAPIKLAVLPLVKKDGLPEIARQLLMNANLTSVVFMKKKIRSEDVIAARMQ